jgi:phage gp29-like protein
VKLGPLEIRLQRNGNQPKPPLTELGATGTHIFGGLLQHQDYNATLVAPEAYDVYDKMRNDGQVRAALTAIKLPLLNADWYIESASDSATDREIAERLERNLMAEMTVSWRNFLRQALLHLDYGSMPFEKVWRLDDGLVMLRKLAPRLPRTIQKWLVDESGGLAGVEQYAPTATDFVMVTIPVSKLLLFVNDLEGSNYRGISILRSAYGHWYMKDGLYRVQCIALEKRGLGVDVGTLKGEARTDDHKRDLERVLMSLHAHEKQFMVEIDEQVGYRLEGIGSGRVLDPLPAIEHHDVRIVRSILAEFLAMGQGSTGSLAMHRDKSAFFMMALGGIANQLSDTINAHLIRPWVDYNWNVTEYPQLRYSRLESRDLQTWADAVLKLSQAAVITADPDIEKEARSLLDLPPQIVMPEEEEELPGETEEEIPTEEAVAAVRTLRRILKRRREAQETQAKEKD